MLALQPLCAKKRMLGACYIWSRYAAAHIYARNVILMRWTQIGYMGGADLDSHNKYTHTCRGINLTPIRPSSFISASPSAWWWMNTRTSTGGQLLVDFAITESSHMERCLSGGRGGDKPAACHHCCTLNPSRLICITQRLCGFDGICIGPTHTYRVRAAAWNNTLGARERRTFQAKLNRSLRASPKHCTQIRAHGGVGVFGRFNAIFASSSLAPLFWCHSNILWSRSGVRAAMLRARRRARRIHIHKQRADRRTWHTISLVSIGAHMYCRAVAEMSVGFFSFWNVLCVRRGCHKFKYHIPWLCCCAFLEL